MGVAAFESALRRHAMVGVDSMVFIYHLEARDPYRALTRALLESIESGKPSGVTSVLSLLELLVQPFEQQRSDLAASYRGLLAEFPHLALVPMDASVAELAASVRAHYGIGTPDAIQVASCLRHGATALVTNDKQLRRVKEMDVLLLSAYL